VKIERSVTVNVEAAHSDNQGKMHGHSYLVQCWITDNCCLAEFEKSVRDAASNVDHTVLEASVGEPSMEALAMWFMQCHYLTPHGYELRLSRVVVTRPTLGYSVEIRA
jgi:6-pyruvoyl-tetrahydropterin synthase